MNSSAEAGIFTGSLLATIRLQRHLGIRIIISTQEPTISPALLDLSSITIVHRFTSPEWLRSLRAHLAPAASDLVNDTADGDVDGDGASVGKHGSNSNGVISKIFLDIVNLRTGEALLFAPSGAIEQPRPGSISRRLGFSYLKIKVRGRMTADGGKSIIAK